MTGKGIKPVVLGCSGPVLTDEERSFFQALNPFGFILFQRPGQSNCDNPEQLRALTSSLRDCTGRPETPIFIDQEGGRVQRLRSSYWPSLPSMGKIGSLYKNDKEAAQDAMRLHASITARTLLDVGINANCAPVLDMDFEGASIVMGDRTFGSDIEAISVLGRIAVDMYLESGVYPVIKHLPGHGRVKSDPHETLPYVDTGLEELEALDFIPFKALNDAPMGMNCHVVFRAIDSEQPVSLSARAQHDIIRGKIGFDGLLLSDDMAMGAQAGPIRERAMRGLKAGADIVLYCQASMTEMREFTADMQDMSPEAMHRWQRAQSRVRQPAASGDVKQAILQLNALLET